MHPQIQTDPYLHVAKIYPHLMSFVSYKWWAKYIYSITKNSIVKNPFVLELSAGNCELAKHLSKLYKNYLATDISKNMLTNSNYNLNKVCCDMTAIPFNKKFDLILSSFDSVNYLLSKKRLLKFFKEVENHLSPDGVLTFDVALESNSYKHQKTATTKGISKGIHYLRQSIFMPASKIHKNIFTIKYPNGEKYFEIHKQKIYSYDTFFEMAEKSELYVVNCYKAFSYQKGRAKSDRVQFIMKRKS
ncbi:MAG: class I SAM-dependent methyltransferase [Ignavibacteriales bacterium]|nr:class I SAM-dependent methyltransferase [Ignavibacteriales bacterium]